MTSSISRSTHSPPHLSLPSDLRPLVCGTSGPRDSKRKEALLRVCSDLMGILGFFFCFYFCLHWWHDCHNCRSTLTPEIMGNRERETHLTCFSSKLRGTDDRPRLSFPLSFDLRWRVDTRLASCASPTNRVLSSRCISKNSISCFTRQRYTPGKQRPRIRMADGPGFRILEP